MNFELKTSDYTDQITEPFIFFFLLLYWLSSWQVISSADAYGFLVCVNELITVQSKVYSKPTVIIACKVTGEEEIPDGVVAVLTPSLIDVLSHVSIRARNSKACTIVYVQNIYIIKTNYKTIFYWRYQIKCPHSP